MILIDTSQLVIASALNEAGYSTKNSEQENSNIIKHIFYNTVRIYNKTHKKKYGKMVFTIDSRNYWRKQIFQYYKQNRKKKRDDSPYDWELIFKIRDELVSELKQYFPYYVIESDGAEADDIRAIFVKNFIGPHLIIASDQDDYQLHSEFVQQYDPKKKQMIELKVSPEEFLLEKIIRGDSGDGICNIRSPNDSFVTKIRQKPITKEFLEECMEDNIPDECIQRFEENRQLIDYNYIPEQLEKDILKVYETYELNNSSNVFNFLARGGYKMLLSDCGDFNV